MYIIVLAAKAFQAPRLRKIVAATAAAAAFVCAIGTVPARAQPSDGATVTELAERLRPYLQKWRKGARIYYRGVCSFDGGFDLMEPPRLALRLARGNGIAAIRHMLPPTAIVEARPGVIAIQLAPTPPALLALRLTPMSLTPLEQFDSREGVWAIERNRGVQAGFARLGYGEPMSDISVLQGAPEFSGPHLPATMSGMTLDEALDQAARTFGDIVFFGTCDQPRLYRITTEGGYQRSLDRHPRGVTRHD